MSQLVTVATFTTLLETELVRGRLEEEGVEAYMADGELVTADWTMSNAVGGVKVRVAAEDADRARTVLAEPVEEPEDYEAPVRGGVTRPTCALRIPARKRAPPGPSLHALPSLALLG